MASDFMTFKVNQIKIPTYFIAFVWLVNGLLCKVLNLVPRHAKIVEAILGATIAPVATVVIGVLEMLMALWILSRIKSKICAVMQIVIIMTMNIIEFIVAPHLLLFGKLNIVIAVLFCLFIYFFEIVKKPKNP